MVRTDHSRPGSVGTAIAITVAIAITSAIAVGWSTVGWSTVAFGLGSRSRRGRPTTEVGSAPGSRPRVTRTGSAQGTRCRVTRTSSAQGTRGQSAGTGIHATTTAIVFATVTVTATVVFTVTSELVADEQTESQVTRAATLMDDGGFTDHGGAGGVGSRRRSATLTTANARRSGQRSGRRSGGTWMSRRDGSPTGRTGSIFATRRSRRSGGLGRLDGVRSLQLGFDVGDLVDRIFELIGDAFEFISHRLILVLGEVRCGGVVLTTRDAERRRDRTEIGPELFKLGEEPSFLVVRGFALPYAGAGELEGLFEVVDADRATAALAHGFTLGGTATFTHLIELPGKVDDTTENTEDNDPPKDFHEARIIGRFMADDRDTRGTLLGDVHLLQVEGIFESGDDTITELVGVELGSDVGIESIQTSTDLAPESVAARGEQGFRIQGDHDDEQIRVHPDLARIVALRLPTATLGEQTVLEFLERPRAWCARGSWTETGSARPHWWTRAG